MDKHTPGPWEMSLSDHQRANIVERRGGRVIASAFSCYHSPEQSEGIYVGGMAANARLIAAAPDLLAALKAIMSEADFGDVALGEMAYAAIAKARAPA